MFPDDFPSKNGNPTKEWSLDTVEEIMIHI
jgi:hypothetical protein